MSRTLVNEIQQGLLLTPLSLYGKDSAAEAPKPTKTYPTEDLAMVQLFKSKKINTVETFKRLSIEEYFNYLNQLLVKNPSAERDKQLLERLAKIGIKPGKTFDLNAFDKETQEALKLLPTQIIASLDSAKTIFSGKKEEKPDTTIGHYGTDYLKRAYVAYFGLGALGPEEAVYLGYRTDTLNQPLNGRNKYVIHFEPSKTPPAQAFWSITLYDKDGYLAENPIRRYAIGDRSNLKYNSDKSLDIFIQNDNPGEGKESNWLPAPKDDFNLSMRIYWPTNEYLKTGNWTKPPIRKVN